MFIFYNILLFTLILFALPLIIPAVLLSEKRRKTVLQRLGLKLDIMNHHTRMKYCQQSPIWIHALSVGEVLSAVPLVRALKKRFPDKDIVFSASTRTGFEIANNTLKTDVRFIFYFPYDVIFSVRRLINTINPMMVIIVETDIWANFLFEMKSRHIPVILVNARLSQRSFSGYKQFSFFFSPLFSIFSNICAQSPEDARRFRCLRVLPESVTITGNMKFDQRADEILASETALLRQSSGISPSRKIFLAGSTHEGEEEILLAAFLQLRKKYPEICLIMVPRNPDRAKSVCGLFRNAGLRTFTFSELKPSETRRHMEVMVADVMGILRKLYAVCDIAFVGGSLIPFGGHNPLEPAAFSKPILFGPDMSDFRDISAMLLKARGAVQVRNAEDIHTAADKFLINPQLARKTGKQAYDVFHANRGAVQHTVRIIEKQIDETC